MATTNQQRSNLFDRENLPRLKYILDDFMRKKNYWTFICESSPLLTSLHCLIVHDANKNANFGIVDELKSWSIKPTCVRPIFIPERSLLLSLQCSYMHFWSDKEGQHLNLGSLSIGAWYAVFPLSHRVRIGRSGAKLWSSQIDWIKVGF